jgi:uncharacterized membrane protein YGL010W
MKSILIFNKIISYLPLGWLVIFSVFILRVYLKLGHMPTYNNPDPKDLGMDINYNMVFWGLPVVLFSAIFWIIAIVGTGIIDRRKLAKVDCLIYIIIYLTIIFLLRSQGLGLGNWLTD